MGKTLSVKWKHLRRHWAGWQQAFSISRAFALPMLFLALEEFQASLIARRQAF